MQKMIQHDALQDPALMHGFTTRAVSDLGQLASALQVSHDRILSLKQIHSAKVVCVSRGSLFSNLPEADALVTSEAGLVLVVKTADCLPVLICDRLKGVVAAVHAGFRGLQSGVIQNTVEVMRGYGCDPRDLKAVLGPCICPAHYEVGPEVIESFQQVYGDRFVYQDLCPRLHLDLRGTASLILQDCGLHERRILSVDLCTFEDERFFSYRRNPTDCGRQFGFVGVSF